MTSATRSAAKCGHSGQKCDVRYENEAHRTTAPRPAPQVIAFLKRGTDDPKRRQQGRLDAETQPDARSL